MSEEQFQIFNKTIKESIYASIETTVNGKIRKLDEKLEAYIVTDDEWKARASPIIEMGNNIKGFGKVLAYVIGTVAVLLGIIKGIR